MKKQSLFLLLIVALSAFACNTNKYPDLEDGIYAEFVTNQGTFVAELYYDKTPMTVANFVSLAEGTNEMVDEKFKGKKYYNGLTFHRIIKDFMIQGGDPEGSGSGGPGYKFPDEIENSLVHDTKGTLSMANAGPGTNGSQFFVTLAPTPHLNGRHTVFGKVVIGQEIVDQLGTVKTGQRDKPVEDIVIEKLNIIKKGSDAKSFEAAKVFGESLEKIEEEKQAEKAAAEKELNNLSEGYEKTDSGLRYKITEANQSGKKPQKGQIVKVHYTGTLANGKQFDSSAGKDPIEFPVGTGKVIPGWDEGLLLLKKGEKARFVIPPHLGYGERGAGGVIPPNAILIFDVELVDVN